MKANAHPLDFGILLGLAYQAFVDELHEHLHECGFTDIGRSYGYVFRALDGNTLHLRQLAERLCMSDQGAVKIVNEMQARGYLERYPDLHDGRIKKLRLSSKGSQALDQAQRFHARYEARLRSAIGRPQLASTRLVLEKMVAKTGTDAAHARLRAP
jgi:DNA-binding MarR family transcriptional regulator